MRKVSIHHLFSQPNITWQLFAGMIISILFSCHQRNTSPQVAAVKKDSIKPPVLVSGILPTLVLLDSCPPPRTVIIPDKPGKFSPRKSDVGMKMIQSMPPETRNAGLFTPMQHFNTEQGLAQGTVYDIGEDINGNLWFCTAGAGVSRYDGKSFTTFTSRQGLVYDFILRCFGDSKGNMWFISFEDGVGCYDGKRFRSYSTHDGLVANTVSSGLEDRNGNIWFGTKSGLSRFDPATQTFRNFTDSNGMVNSNIGSLIVDNQGVIWLGLRGGVAKMNPDRQSFTYYQDMDGKNVIKIFEDKDGNIYAGCYEGVFFITNEEKSLPADKVHFKKIGDEKKLPSSIILDMLQDRKGMIWVATRAGLSCFDPTVASFNAANADIKNYQQKQGLSSNNTLAIHEDKKGNIWIGTNGGGVSRLDQGGRTISTFTTEQGLTENHVLFITKDKKNRIWFGTEGGMSVMEPDGKTFQSITTAQGLVDYWTFSIAEDKENNIWFCTQGDGVSRMDPDWKTITTYSRAQGLPGIYFSYIYEAKNGIMWLGSESGISLYDGKFITNYTSEQGIDVNSIVNQIIEDRHGNTWAATEAGVYRFAIPDTLQPGNRFVISHFTTDQGLAHNSVKSILEDDSGNLWFCTLGNGMSRYDGKTFLNFGTTDGMPDDGIYTAIKDTLENIWIGSNKGISVLKGFTKQTGNGSQLFQSPGKLSNAEIVNGFYKPVIETYHTTTGYPIKDIYGLTLHITDNNIVWAGTGENLVRFDYNSLYKDTALPKVFIQSLKINNEKVVWNNLPSLVPENVMQQRGNSTISAAITEEVTLFGRRLNVIQRDSLRKKFGDIAFDSITPFYPIPVNPILPYRHNNITFDFAAIETARPFLVRYQYILDGYDDEWSPATDKTTASFGNIREGQYTFRLKAQSPDGVWSNPLIYRFTVLPPWYRTWWAYAMYACVFVISISAFIRWRIKSLRKEKLLLEEKVVFRTHELQEEKEKVETTLSELKATQSQLVQREKMASLGELTAGIAHEIQNPLNFVNNFSEVNKELAAELKSELAVGNLQLAADITSDIIDNSEKINHHGKRADAIVKGMLQHSRTSTGQKELTDINALADEYLRLSYHGIRAKDKNFNATIQTDFDNSIGKINIIPQDIGRVLLNLYNNAFYATNEKAKSENYQPTVSVKTKKTGDKILISVSDNGNGIPQHIIDKIFQPFFTTKPTGQGTGLGLSLAYDIVKAHGGEISVRSESGQGTVFVIQLII